MPICDIPWYYWWVLANMRCQSFFRVLCLFSFFLDIRMKSSCTKRSCRCWWQISIDEIRLCRVQERFIPERNLFVISLRWSDVPIRAFNLHPPSLDLIVRFLDERSIIHGWSDSAVKVIILSIRTSWLSSDIEVDFVQLIVIISWI